MREFVSAKTLQGKPKSVIELATSSGCTNEESYCTSAFAAISATNTLLTPKKRKTNVKTKIINFTVKQYL